MGLQELSNHWQQAPPAAPGEVKRRRTCDAGVLHLLDAVFFVFVVFFSRLSFGPCEDDQQVENPGRVEVSQLPAMT